MQPEGAYYFALMFMGGLAGGFGHCLGMCGPLVAAYCMGGAGRSFMAQVLYHLGRTMTYAMLGAAAGVAGTLVLTASNLQSVQRGVMVGAGVVVMAMGLMMLWGRRLLIAIEQRGAGLLPVERVAGFLREQGGLGAGGHFPLGVVMGFLPCGLVYTALLAAARGGMDAGGAAGGLLMGAGGMVCFGLGTAPALLMVWTLSRMMGIKWRQRLVNISAIAMVMLGVLFIVRALN